MKKPTKTTSANLGNRAARFVAHVLEVGKDGAFACAAFDRMLDELADEDFFGTERQSDPRGDMRG